MFKGASAWFTNSGIWDSTVSARPWACAGVLARASAHVHSASAMAIGPCMVFQLAMRAIEAPSPCLLYEHVDAGPQAQRIRSAGLGLRLFRGLGIDHIEVRAAGGGCIQRGRRTTRLGTGGRDVSGIPVPIGLLKPCRSEEHTSELQSQSNLVCRLLLEKKKKYK